jgi:hypothetical protein
MEALSGVLSEGNRNSRIAIAAFFRIARRFSGYRSNGYTTDIPQIGGGGLSGSSPRNLESVSDRIPQ